ncbi:luciferin 4-monooxygenase-like, partial [Aphomia sociella]
MLRNPLYIYGKDEISIPVGLNFAQFVLKKIWQHGERTMLINGINEEVYTYRQLAQEALNISVSLTLLGVRKGDTVAVCSENRKEFWPSLLGSAGSGAVTTTVNPMYTAGELKHVFSISKPKYIFCSQFFYKNHAKTLKQFPYIKQVILFGDERPEKVLLFKDLAIPGNSCNSNIVDNNRLTRNVTFEEFLAADVVGQTDVLLILYSSGTTGLPKGVMLTHYNVLSFCSMFMFGDADTVGLSITPWYHAMGLIGFLSGFVVGRTNVFLPKFEIDLYLRTIEKYKIVRLTLVPPVLIAACKSTANYDLSSVLLIASGAAPLQSDTIAMVKQKFPNVQAVLQAYGMTECTLAVTMTDFENRHAVKNGSVGVIVPNAIAKVVDTETRQLLGPNQHGELCFKGPTIMKGYVGKDKKEDFDEEGFFRTGDIGYYDEDGHFYIVDRLKELIKYKANQ